ncbi:hypothetical protein CCHR01_16299 [Colletotrichum chrysophilum]|uniref:Uncharacterized protein n=1 Tax=Colletotrichum chrysophilum TaxID=1836956 RepID=A0AAD9EDK9_9PEZI|nr:hypothetical protein CCHR01_16299 [Colletotrichum chrysophilum]
MKPPDGIDPNRLESDTDHAHRINSNAQFDIDHLSLSELWEEKVHIFFPSEARQLRIKTFDLPAPIPVAFVRDLTWNTYPVDNTEFLRQVAQKIAADFGPANDSTADGPSYKDTHAVFSWDGVKGLGECHPQTLVDELRKIAAPESVHLNWSIMEGIVASTKTTTGRVIGNTDDPQTTDITDETRHIIINITRVRGIFNTTTSHKCSEVVRIYTIVQVYEFVALKSALSPDEHVWSLADERSDADTGSQALLAYVSESSGTRLKAIEETSSPIRNQRRHIHRLSVLSQPGSGPSRLSEKAIDCPFEYAPIRKTMKKTVSMIAWNSFATRFLYTFSRDVVKTDLTPRKPPPQSQSHSLEAVNTTSKTGTQMRKEDTPIASLTLTLRGSRGGSYIDSYTKNTSFDCRTASPSSAATSSRASPA